MIWSDLAVVNGETIYCFNDVLSYGKLPSNKPALQVSKRRSSRPSGHSRQALRWGGGADDLRPQHLANLVQSHEVGPRLLTSITALENDLINGKCRKTLPNSCLAVAASQWTRNPAALYVWRRLAAKCASVSVTNTLTDYFSSLQLRVRAP